MVMAMKNVPARAPKHTFLNNTNNIVDGVSGVRMYIDICIFMYIYRSPLFYVHVNGLCTACSYPSVCSLTTPQILPLDCSLAAKPPQICTFNLSTHFFLTLASLKTFTQNFVKLLIH